MSEINELNLENTAQETAEAVQEPAEGAAEKVKKNKKRKRAKIALPAVAILLVIALLFGTVVGYILGRKEFENRLHDAQAQITALTAAFEEAAAAPVYDAFNEEITGENRLALSDLAGNEAVADETSILGEDLLGEMLQGEAQEPVVVAEFNGGVLMSDEVAREYQQQLADLVFSGYSEEEVSATLLNEVMQYMVGDRVMLAKAKEMGLYDLTEADQAEIDALAQEIFDAQFDFFSDYVNTDGMTEEEAAGAVKSYMLENEGVSPESIRSELAEGWWMEKLYNEITRDVTINDNDLQKTYNEIYKQQKTSFDSYVDDYEYAQMNGEAILYNLGGYRAVRVLLFSFDEMENYEAVLALSDSLLELDTAKDAEQIAEIVAEIDGYYAGVDAEAFDALNQLTSGADFEELLLTIGDDEGMKDEHLRRTGYYVSRDSLLWPAEIIDAAMSLQKPGDLSGAVRVADGVCILQYVGDVKAGPVPLDDVKVQLADDVLEAACYEAYEQQLSAWLSEADAKYYPERMQ